jgi:putative endonuclease
LKSGFVYILASARNGTLYIGVTSDLKNRVWQHKEGQIEGFTKQHGCKTLVWYQYFDNLHDARRREVQMKSWKRLWKLREIEEMNPEWTDLYGSLEV